jgi:hypothetical protein
MPDRRQGRLSKFNVTALTMLCTPRVFLKCTRFSLVVTIQWHTTLWRVRRISGYIKCAREIIQLIACEPFTAAVGIKLVSMLILAAYPASQACNRVLMLSLVTTSRNSALSLRSRAG